MRMALLKLAVLVLAGTSWIFTSFILASRPEGSEDPLSTLVRLPASLPAQIPGISSIPVFKQNLTGLQPPPRSMEIIPMDVVRVPCWDRAPGTARQTGAHWVRLTGKSCQSQADADTITVRNLTNGYVATIFSTSSEGLTTDFIPLQAGNNDILIRYAQPEGVAVENRFSFNRE